MADHKNTDDLRSPITPSPEPGAGDELFQVDYLKANLRNRTVRGAIITVSAQAAKFILNLISTFTLARLLTPADFGLVAMVIPIAAFVGLFKDLGLTIATVQRDQVDHAQISTLFWINVAISISLATITMALSPLVGLFYGDIRTTWITLATGAIFIFGGFTAQHQALLTRHMRFGLLAIIDVTTMACSITAGILAGWFGWGYWALVIMSAVGGIVNLVMVWSFSPWKPGRPVRGSGVRSMLKFGGGLTAVNLVIFFNTNIARVVLGKVSGAKQLGLYNRSHSLFMAQLMHAIGPIGNVVVPAMSRLADDNQRLRGVASTAMELTTALALPLGALCFFAPDWVVLGMLGSQWTGAIPIVRVLSALTFWISAGSVINWLLVAKGRSGVLLIWEIFWSAVVLVAVLVGSHYGAFGVALGITIGMLGTAPAYIAVGHWFTPLKASDTLRVLAPNIFNIAAAFACVWFIRTVIHPAYPLMGLIISALLILLVHLGILFATGKIQRAIHLLRDRSS